MQTDSIFALSSGAPPAAIAVVRISGPDAAAALTALAGSLPPPRRATLRRLHHPQSGVPLDDALILWFPGPGSATGEDLAELHLHGGRAVVAAVLAALATLPNLRPAEPGEFTRRALTHGRIDLAQAEGLADLLSAETEAQRRNALHFSMGHVSQALARWQDRLLALSAGVEAQLDFADEDDVAADAAVLARLRADAATIAAELRAWLARPAAERLKAGVAVVIAGPPNAGKSTLFNALVERDAAITAPEAGTTRDVLEAHFALAGTAFRLLDTAGLRAPGADRIEAIGMERAAAAMAAADIILWLGQPEAAPEAHQARLVRVATHMDARGKDPAWQALAARCDVRISALTGAGLADLQAILLNRAAMLLPGADEAAINARQRAVLRDVLAALGRGNGDADGPSDETADVVGHADPLIFAEQLRAARAALDRMTGRAGTEDMLDALFGRFCIGK